MGPNDLNFLSATENRKDQKKARKDIENARRVNNLHS
jgi:hypothetical protein